MSCARHIGRIGALAVFLGVGVAVATAPGIAYAEPSDSGSVSSSPSDPAPKDEPSSASSSSTEGSDSSGRSAVGGSAQSEPDPAQPSSQDTGDHDGGLAGGTGGARPAGTDDIDVAEITSAAADPVTGGAGDPAPSTDLTPPETGEPSIGGGVWTHDDRPVPEHSGHQAGQSPAREASSAAMAVGAEAAPDDGVDRRDAENAVGRAAPGQPLTEDARAAAADAQGADTLAAVSADAPTPAPTAATIWDLPGTVVGVATRLWSDLATQLLATLPSVTDSPLLWMMTSFARREFETLLDVGPTLSAGTLASGNLLLNGDAESGDPSLTGYSGVTVPGWDTVGIPTVLTYGQQRTPSSMLTIAFPSFLASILAPFGWNFPGGGGLFDTLPADRGKQFFGGGPVATTAMSQTVDLSAASAEINGGNVAYNLSAWLGGFQFDPSQASVTVNFLDQSGASTGAGGIGPVSILDRLFVINGFQERQTAGVIPKNTVTAVVTVNFTDLNPAIDGYNNAYADNVSFSIGSNSVTPKALEPPKSTVGHLDHVYVIFMENKGYDDITGPLGQLDVRTLPILGSFVIPLLGDLGKPPTEYVGAPYINRLIEGNLAASNYYSLMHPSNPTYAQTIAGTDVMNYNCYQDCVDAPQLMDSIEAKGLTWAGYAEDSYNYVQGVEGGLPFLEFSDIYHDPARVGSHIFNLDKLETDMEIEQVPNFAWIAANDEHNMEGPSTGTDTGQFFSSGRVLWALNLAVGWITDRLGLQWLGLPLHQYNVRGGDDWLQEHIQTITGSKSWNDPNQASAIFLTFDEDSNNLSLGNGNQGNHVVFTAISSPGARAAGMKSGPFVDDTNYNHYNLMRTIEDALGLDPLTNNDKYAKPMNSFWN